MRPMTYAELLQKTVDFEPENLVREEGFNGALYIAQAMLTDDHWDDNLHMYATKLLEALRKRYPKEWNSSWLFDAYLGYAHDIALEYDERYASYKRALDKVSPAPPELLIAMAKCCRSPGEPLINENEAISIVKQVIAETPYIEAIGTLCGLYKTTGNVKDKEYWENVLKKMDGNGPHLPSLEGYFNKLLDTPPFKNG